MEWWRCRQPPDTESRQRSTCRRTGSLPGQVLVAGRAGEAPGAGRTPGPEDTQPCSERGSSGPPGQLQMERAISVVHQKKKKKRLREALSRSGSALTERTSPAALALILSSSDPEQQEEQASNGPLGTQWWWAGADLLLLLHHGGREGHHNRGSPDTSGSWSGQGGRVGGQGKG